MYNEQFLSKATKYLHLPPWRMQLLYNKEIKQVLKFPLKNL